MSDKNVKVEITLPALPKGYKYTGEYRRVSPGEWCFIDGELIRWKGFLERTTTEKYPIIKKCEWWEDIPEHGILCWVWDYNEYSKRLAVVYSNGKGAFSFKGEDCMWRNARPIMGKEICNYLIENN